MTEGRAVRIEIPAAQAARFEEHEGEFLEGYPSRLIAIKAIRYATLGIPVELYRNCRAIQLTATLGANWSALVAVVQGLSLYPLKRLP